MTYALSQAFNPNPPPAKPPNVGMMLAWGALVAMTGGILYYTVMPSRSMAKNRRRSSRRRGSRDALTTAQRARIPLKDFVFPERRAYPIDTATRARGAVAMMHLGRVASASDFNELRNAIRTRYPRIWTEHGRGLTWQKVRSVKQKARLTRRSSRLAANPKIVGNPLSQSLIRSRIKSSTATLSRAGAPKAVLKSAKCLPEGVYRLSGRGDVIVHRDASVTPSLIRSTRIAASKSPSSQMWLVQVVRSSSGRRRAVPVRGYKRVGGRTEAVFRIEAT